MKELTSQEMVGIDGGVKWKCVAIGAFIILSGANPVSLLFYLAAGVAAGCFD